MNNGHIELHDIPTEAPQTSIWDGKSWRITNAALIREITRDQGELFASHPCSLKRQGPESLLFEQAIFLDGERHQVIRQVLDLALRQMVQPGGSHLQAIRATCTQMIKERISLGSMDLARDLAWPLTDTILSTISGVPLHSQEMREGADAVADWTSGHKKDETQQQIERFKTNLLRLMARRGNQMREQRPADLLSVLLAHASALDEETLLANAMMCAAAGRHALSNTLTGGVWLLLREGDLWTRLHEVVATQPKLLHPLLERLLCLLTPTTQIARWAKEAILLDGLPLERGHKLILDLEAANHSICPHLGKVAEEVTRPLPRPHFSFGDARDPHFCPGAQLSREVLRHTLLTLLQEIPTLRLVRDEEPARSSNPTIGGIVSLPVCWQH